MKFIDWVKFELDIILKESEEEAKDRQKILNDGVLDMIKIIVRNVKNDDEINETINMITKLLNFKPLTPLTGNDDEWEQVDCMMQQNIRDGEIFKVLISDDNNIDRSFAYNVNGGQKRVEFPYDVK